MDSSTQFERTAPEADPDQVEMLRRHNDLRDFIAAWQTVARANNLGWWQWSAQAGYGMYFNPFQEQQHSAITQLTISNYKIVEPGSLAPHKSTIGRISTEYQAFQVEIQIDYENGQRQYFILSTTYPRDCPPEKVQVVGVFNEVTQERSREHTQQIQEKRFQVALQASNAALWEIDHTKTSGFVSDKFFELLGYQADDTLWDADSILALVHPDDRALTDQLLADMDQAARNKFQIEVRLKARDGQYRCLMAHGQVIEWDRFRKPKRTVGIVTDITERKQMEDALRRSEERYREIVELQSELICRYLPDGTITFANQAYCRFFGKQLDALLGRKFWKFVHPEDLEAARARLEQAWLEQKPFVSLQREMTGERQIRWVEWTDHPSIVCDGVVQEYQAVGRDVTERVLAEAALRENDQRLRLLTDKSSDMIAILRPEDLAVQFVSPACLDILNVEPQAMVGNSAYEWVYPPDHTSVKRSIRQQLDQNEALNLEFRMVRADSQVIWVEMTGKFVSSPETGKQAELITITREITDRKQDEQRSRVRTTLNFQLRAIEQMILSASSGSEFLQPVVDKLANFLDSSLVYLWTFDPDQQVLRLTARADTDMDQPVGQEIRLQPGESWETLRTGILMYNQALNLPAGLNQILTALPASRGSRRLLLPIQAQQELIGLLVVVETGTQRLGPQYIEFLLQVSISLAHGLRQAAFFSELRQHIHLQDALRDVSLELIGEPDLDSLLNLILYHSLEFSSANAGRIYIRLEETNMLRCVAAVGYASDIADPDLDPDSGLTGKALKEGRLIFQRNYSEWDGRVRKFDGLKLNTVVAVPIIHGRDKYGAIVLNLPENVPFNKQKEDFLNLFAVQAAVVFRKASIYEQERRASHQLRELHHHMESAREAERARISREIHDELGQRLTALKMDAAWIARRISQRPRSVHSKLIEMQELIDQTIHDVRQVATELRPGLLDEFGLTAAMEWKLQDFAERQKIQTDYELETIAEALDEATTIAIYRIFQETLTNIVRHAQASRVDVKLLDLKDELLLSVRDNGIGMVDAYYPSETSLGLLGMKERANSIGAIFDIVSAPQQGTQVTLRVPLRSAGKGNGNDD